MLIKSDMMIIFYVAIHVICGKLVIAQNISMDKDYLYQFETELRQLEFIRFNRVLGVIKTKNISVNGFYHTSAFKKYWQSIIIEQLKIINGSRYNSTLIDVDWDSRSWTSLLSITQNFHITFTGNNHEYSNFTSLVKSLHLRNDDKISLAFSPMIRRDTYQKARPRARKDLRNRAMLANLTEGEYGTMVKLHTFCKEQRENKKKSFVFYFHSKSSCCPRELNYPAGDWREMMNTFILEFPSICMRALLNGYTTCGVNYGDAHFSGNFWWADCDHVAALPGLWDPINNAYACETFIFNVSNIYSNRHNFAKNCGYHLYNCNVDHYHVSCPRTNYLSLLKDFVVTDTLPRNQFSPQNNPKEFTSKYCHNSYLNYYKKQSTWNQTEFLFS